MVLVASMIPGASYTSATFTIPWSALTALTTVDATPIDSFERLLHTLLTIVHEKCTANTITQVSCGVEVASKSLSVGTWEGPTANSFADILVDSFLVCFSAGSSLTPLLINSNTVTNA
jgi:hypothetical protein